MTNRIGNYLFDGPYPLGSEFVCPGEGVYAILCEVPEDQVQRVPVDQRVHGSDGRIYVVLYIGETEDVNDRLTSSHQAWDCFHERCASPLVAFHHMPGSTREDRRVVEDELIAQYLPPCNSDEEKARALHAFYRRV